MVLSGSRSVSVVRCCSHWFSRFSAVLSGSRRFSIIISGSRRFSVVPYILNDSLWFFQ